jgi:hypothetical protein
MDITLYGGLIYFIKHNREKFPKRIDEETKKEIENQHQNYTLGEDKITLYYQNDRRVLREDEFEELLMETHDDGGHFGSATIYDMVRPKYYWPRMLKHIEKYVKACDACQMKSGMGKLHEPLHPIKVTHINQLWGIDCVGPLPETSRKNKYIIVATEHFTKWPEAKAVPDIKATTIADFLYNEIVTRYGTPEKILSDQGSSFDNQLVKAFLEVMGTRHTMTTAYHPQTNGHTEKFNGTLCNTISKLMYQKGNEWDHWVNTALFHYRKKPHATTKIPPCLAFRGWSMKTPFELNRESNTNESEDTTLEQHVELISNKLNRVHKIISENTDKAQERQKKAYDKHVKPIRYKVGQKVMLHNERKTNKFDRNWLGPYRIQATFDNGTYSLSDIEDGRIVEISVNSKRLKEYFDKPAYVPKTIVIQDEERIKELEERAKQMKRDTRRKTPGEIIRQKAEEELKQMKQIEAQIKERHERQKKETELLERNKASEIVRQQQKKQNEELDNRLRQQMRLRIITKKDRQGLVVIKDKENQCYQN